MKNLDFKKSSSSSKLTKLPLNWFIYQLYRIYVCVCLIADVGTQGEQDNDPKHSPH